MIVFRGLIIICIFFLNTNTIINANRLSTITTHIKETKRLLLEKRTERDILNQKLANQEKEMAILRTAQALNNTQRQTTQSKIEKLKQQQNQLKNKLKTQQTTLGQLLAQGYILQRQPMLKRLLNPARNTQPQLMTYFNYISRQQIDQIKQLKATLNQINQTQSQLENQYKQQVALSKQQQEQQLKIHQLQQSRRQTISALDRQIKNKKARLKALIKDQSRLEQMLARIKKQSLKTEPALKKGKRRWLWPTEGRVTQKFGTKIEESGLTWKGILIESPEGQPIRATASGKVVFARWLSGYGQLIIIDHGHGYISLYGRNERLNVKINEQVKRGQTIAWVGSSGGFEKSALYFAIRYNGQAIDPIKWYAKK